MWYNIGTGIFMPTRCKDSVKEGKNNATLSPMFLANSAVGFDKLFLCGQRQEHSDNYYGCDNFEDDDNCSDPDDCSCD